MAAAHSGQSRPAHGNPTRSGGSQAKPAAPPLAKPTAEQSRALSQLLAPIVAGAGLDLEAVTIKAAGRRRQVRVVVDEPGGLNLDRVAELSRLVSAALDESDVLGDFPYVLEVTSPGVARPLTVPRHWANAVGRLVEVKLRDGSQVTGRVRDTDDAGVVLDVPAGQVRVAYDQVARAVVQVEFSRIAEVDLGDDDGEPGGDELDTVEDVDPEQRNAGQE